MKLIVVSALVLASSAVWAKPAKYSAQVASQSPFTAVEYSWTSAEASQKLKAQFEKSKRVPSSQLKADEDMMSTEFKATRNKFLAIKTPEELETFLTDLDKNFDSFKENDQKFFAAQIIPLRELRGFLWKSQPVFSKTKITHSVVLTAVKSTVSAVQVYLPTDQWKAGLGYVSQPFARDQKVSTQFQNEADVVSFVSGAFRQSLLKSARRIQALDLKDSYIAWDNKLLYGKASFQDDIDRYRLVGEVERLSTLASLHATLSQIAYQRAYSAENSLNMYQDIGKLYGFDGFFSKVDGAPASKRSAVMRKPAYQNYGVLVEDGAKWMEQSFQHMRESVRLTSALWNQIKREDRPISEAFIFDSTFARPYERGGDLSMANLEAMVEGRAQIRSGITGEVVVVDLPGFFSNPPQDLKAFLPTEFESSQEWKNIELKDGAGKVHKLKARNYEVGRGVNWDSATYKSIFPEISSGKSVPESIRILSQSWGGWMAAMPLSEVVE